MNNASPLTLIRTTEEQISAINLIEDMLAENFKTKPNPKDKDASLFSGAFYSAVFNEIKKLNEERDAVEKMLSQLLSDVKSMSKIKITLARFPDDEILSELENWLTKNSLDNFVFDISIDPKILGGIILSTPKGEYKDYSLSTQIDEYFAKQTNTL